MRHVEELAGSGLGSWLLGADGFAGTRILPESLLLGQTVAVGAVPVHTGLYHQGYGYSSI